jgi:hypothetical protein
MIDGCEPAAAPLANKWRILYYGRVDEGRKRVLAIVAGILVARHLKTADDLFDSKPTPRNQSLVAAAVQWAERIMRKIDNVFPER